MPKPTALYGLAVESVKMPACASSKWHFCLTCPPRLLPCLPQTSLGHPYVGSPTEYNS